MASNASRDLVFRNTVVQVAVLLCLLVIVVVLPLLLLVKAPWWLALVIAPLLSTLATWVWHRGASARVFSQLGIDDSVLCGDPRLANLVEGLSLSTGIEEPALYELDDPSRNALALTDGEAASVVVTSGLIKDLGRMELEAVVAAALVRIKSGDAAIDTLAAGMFSYPMIDGPLAQITSPVGRWAMRKVVVPDADIAADQAAVGVTRYPPGLSSALEKISESYHPARATAGNDHLWVAPPLTTEAVVPHSPLQWRIDILLEF